MTTSGDVQTSIDLRTSYRALEDDEDDTETLTEQWKQTLTAMFDAAQAKVAKTLGEQIFEEKVKNVMYGGLDGVITTFAIVCAGIGMQLTDKEIFIIALASLFADAFSMGYGDFVSSNMQRNYYVQEYDKSKRCYRVNHDQEVARFTDLLLAKGLDYEDATRIGYDLQRSSSLLQARRIHCTRMYLLTKSRA